MHTTWVFSINKDDEQLLNQVKKETGISADHRPSIGHSSAEPLLVIWCEDDDTGCALMRCFLELRGDDDERLKDDLEGYAGLRLRTVLFGPLYIFFANIQF